MSRVDLSRRVWVLASAVLGAAGLALGSGLIGPSVGDNGSEASVAGIDTLLAPAGPAFSMWTLIYLGLLGYVVVHTLPSRAEDERFRSTGWLAGWSLLLNAGWILVTQLSPVPALGLWGSLVVIVVLALVCGTLLARLGDPATNRIDAVVVDATFGLYLGWVSVATVANATATLVGSGVDPGAPLDRILAVVVLVLVVGLAGVLVARLGARVSLAVALIWGLVWIGIGRLTEPPETTTVAVAAGAAAVAVIGLVVVRMRSGGLRL